MKKLLLGLLALGGYLLNSHSAICAERASDQLRSAMQQLWIQHGVRTHTYIATAIDTPNDPFTKAATDYLLQNQDDIGNAIKPFYGNAAGNALTKLLKEHIVIAADVVAAARAGNKAKLTAADKKWHKNADDIAAFLNKANPKQWSLKDVKNMMYEHLKLTTDEAVAYLKHDWNSFISTYRKVLHQLLEMADMLSTGIIKQFPKNFRK